MPIPRELVTYLAKQVVKRLLEAKLIQIEQPAYVLEVISQVMLDELMLEDRINDEVRRILEEHGGRLELHSREGEGTIVTLWLPLRGETVP